VDGAQRSGRNRRRNLRAAVELPVAWRDVREGTTRLTSTIDLSASGMAVRSPVRLPPGARLYVVVGHETLGLRFETTAEVVRSRADGLEFVVSLVFPPLQPAVAAAIGSHVVRSLATGDSADE
jgi:PilZ domain